MIHSFSKKLNFFSCRKKYRIVRCIVAILFQLKRYRRILAVSFKVDSSRPLNIRCLRQHDVNSKLIISVFVNEWFSSSYDCLKCVKIEKYIKFSIMNEPTNRLWVQCYKNITTDAHWNCK